eukprot:COSAG02_NODE_72_length_41961_cov_13.243658_4_plen_211_part_00
MSHCLSVAADLQVFDADGSNDIDAKELQHVFSLIGDPLSEEEATVMIESVDADESGTIDFRELVGMLAAREQAKAADIEVLEAFRVLSELQDGAGGNNIHDNEIILGATVCIGREGVTEALNSLVVDGLENDAALTEQVVTTMLQWMNGSLGAAGEVGLISLDVFKEKMLQLGAGGDDAAGGSRVENPAVGDISSAEDYSPFTVGQMTHS